MSTLIYNNNKINGIMVFLALAWFLAKLSQMPSSAETSYLISKEMEVSNLNPSPGLTQIKLNPTRKYVDPNQLCQTKFWDPEQHGREGDTHHSSKHFGSHHHHLAEFIEDLFQDLLRRKGVGKYSLPPPQSG